MATGAVIGGMAMIFGSLLVLGFFLFFFLTFNKSHIFVVRDILNKSAYINFFRMIEVEDKENGTYLWRSVWWQPRIETPKPPDTAVDITSKGKKVAEAYQVSEGQFVWIEDKGVKVEDRIDSEGKKHKVILETLAKGKQRVIDTFRPFSVVQRDVLINQRKKADMKRKNRWTPEHIVALTGILGLVIIIVMLFIFYGDIAKPAIDSHNLALNVQKQNTEILARMGQGCLAQTAPDQISNVITQPGSEKAPG